MRVLLLIALFGFLQEIQGQVILIEGTVRVDTTRIIVDPGIMPVWPGEKGDIGPHKIDPGIWENREYIIDPALRPFDNPQRWEKGLVEWYREYKQWIIDNPVMLPNGEYVLWEVYDSTAEHYVIKVKPDSSLAIRDVSLDDFMEWLQKQIKDE